MCLVALRPKPTKISLSSILPRKLPTKSASSAGCTETSTFALHFSLSVKNLQSFSSCVFFFFRTAKNGRRYKIATTMLLMLYMHCTLLKMLFRSLAKRIH
uniref:(northern house mosquito) hypothetical protein n=1 Tax=Culex pipiens TaxID=7175 RepID=A0A8D8L655_CULPI